MATARITTGYGNVPGYGKITPPPKKRPSRPNSLQSGAARALNPTTFAPSPPAAPTLGSSAGAAAVPGGPRPLPPDATYDMQIGAYGQRRDDALAGYAGQKTSTLADYGYTASYNPDGSVASLTVDPNNPYSRAAQLKRSYDQSKAGTTNSLAARGQFGSAMTNAQNSNDRGFAQGKDSMEKGLGSILAAIIGGERTARTDYNTNAAGAYGERVGRVPDNPLYSPTPDAPAPATSPSVADLVKQWQSSGVKTEYENSNGHKVRVFTDGHKEVLVNGQWKRV